MKPTFNVREQSEIYIGPTADILSGVLPEGRVIVVSDATIDRLYHPLLAPYDTVLIGAGESIKTLQTVESIYRRFIELGADRSTFVLAVGGGIVTDVAGFAAATYMRGLSFGFVSTTLLGAGGAASVGGKNGVNVDGYKNMAGTFKQPRFVICDPETLRTLSDREFRARACRGRQGGRHRRRRPFRPDRSHVSFDALRCRHRPAYGCCFGRGPRQGRYRRTRRARVGRPPQAQPRAYAGPRHREVLEPDEPRRGRGRRHGA